MMGLGDVNIREASTIRFTHAFLAAMQGVMAMSIFGDLVPSKVAGSIALVVAFGQIFLAAWNSGLHNQPARTYEPPKDR